MNKKGGRQIEEKFRCQNLYFDLDEIVSLEMALDVPRLRRRVSRNTMADHRSKLHHSSRGAENYHWRAGGSLRETSDGPSLVQKSIPESHNNEKSLIDWPLSLLNQHFIRIPISPNSIPLAGDGSGS